MSTTTAPPPPSPTTTAAVAPARTGVRRRLSKPLVVAGILAVGFLAVAFAIDSSFFALLMAIFAISTLLLLPSVAVGKIAARGGSRREGDIAMAIFAGYVIGQFMPLFY